MSGSSSSGRSYMGGLSISDEPEECMEIKGSVRVVSPTMTYFSTVLINTTLEVVLSDAIVVLLNHETGDEVGSLNPSNITKLKECLEQGYKYEANIYNKDGASIDVQLTCIGKK
ncbi:MAG: hypothetical protein DRG78_19645 [Epsilonproteobacteria bacterium]|nr:MAG: hypothetical protein DRG78_19645 [Campylobacterota bacterium]